MIPELASTLVILPARGGSKRIPNKNIIEIYGEPMIFWPLKALRNLFSAEKVLVSTDSEKVKAIVCLGTDNTKIHEAFFDIEKPIVDTLSMKEAVAKAFALSEKNDTVLLSPACASFDLFKSYEDRGSQFKNEVRNL